LEAVKKEKLDLEILSKWRLALMGVAALLIFIFHEWQCVFDDTPFLLLTRIEAYARRFGYYGVDIFFLLSGMGLAYAMRSRPSLPAFYAKRAVRVLPAFLISGILIALTDHWTLAQFFGNVSGWNFYHTYVYSFLWYNTAILTLYVLFPAYHAALERAKQPVLFTGAVILVWAVLLAVLQGALREDLYAFANRVPVFLAGCAVGKMNLLGKKRLPKGFWAVMWGAAAAALILLWLTIYKDMPLLVPIPECAIPTFLLAFSSSFLFAGFFEKAFGRSKKKNWFIKFLEFYGSMSLEFYCIQEWLCGKVLNLLAPWASHEALINLVLFICATAAAFVLHWVCSKIAGLILSFGTPKRAELSGNT
jgi:peptidoglycan/LPS O-acetylase OafA/YrhL